MSAATPASTSSATCQSKLAISVCVIGSSRNWPNEPAEVAMPIARLRRSGATVRPMTARMMPNEVPPSAPPSRTALFRCSSHGMSMYARPTRPRM